MDLEFTDDQEELRASVRSFLDKECPLSLVRTVVETGEAPEKLWASMVSLDWPGLAIPEDCGGVGLSFVETAVVVEELGRVIAPGPFLATTTQFAPVVRGLGIDRATTAVPRWGGHRCHHGDVGVGRPPAPVGVGRRHHPGGEIG